LPRLDFPGQVPQFDGQCASDVSHHSDSNNGGSEITPAADNDDATTLKPIYWVRLDGIGELTHELAMSFLSIGPCVPPVTMNRSSLNNGGNLIHLRINGKSGCGKISLWAIIVLRVGNDICLGRVGIAGHDAVSWRAMARAAVADGDASFEVHAQRKYWGVTTTVPPVPSLVVGDKPGIENKVSIAGFMFESVTVEVQSSVVR